MGMVVRTNTMAINANNALGKNNSSVSKSLEKLSSGFKINRAADDASGLAISEKMKAQIKALDTASANAQDGVSLLQTAEGYMGEVHDMLNRVVELAEKSANGTYEVKDGKTALTENLGDTGVDRQALQDEVNQLTAEIDRISETANFNQLKLFNGTMDTSAERTLTATVAADSKAMGAGEAYLASDATIAAKTGTELTLQIGETSTSSDKLQVSLKSLKTTDLFADMSKYSLKSTAAGEDATASTIKLTGNNDISESSGITVNVSNQQAASVAAEKVRDVINDVSSQRASIGAMQNRLEYTQNNLDTASENISSANSRIRDTDMAKEMMSYTQGTVLTQAAQAMLAQANQQPSNVLQLLQ